MNTIALAADATTLVLNGTIIGDLIAGDNIVLTPANPRTSRIDNLNSANIQGRADANVYDLAVNVEKFSDSDKFFNSALNEDIPVLFEGSVKEVYYLNGVQAIESYSITAGSLTDQPANTKNNTDGNASMTYTLRVNAKRLL